MGSSKQLKQIKKIVSHVRPQDIQTINIIGKAIDHKYFVLENNEVIKTSDLINNIRFGIAHYTINGTFLIPAKHKDGSDYVYTQSDGEGSNNLSSLQIYSDVEIKKLLAQQKPKQKVVTRPPYSFAKLPIDAKEFEHNPHTVKIPNKNFISIAQLQTAPKKLSSLLSLITWILIWLCVGACLIASASLILDKVYLRNDKYWSDVTYYIAIGFYSLAIALTLVIMPLWVIVNRDFLRLNAVLPSISFSIFIIGILLIFSGILLIEMHFVHKGHNADIHTYTNWITIGLISTGGILVDVFLTVWIITSKIVLKVVSEPEIKKQILDVAQQKQNEQDAINHSYNHLLNTAGMPSEDLEPTDDQKVVAYDDFAIQLASGKILSKEETFKNIKGGKTDLFVKSNENKLSHIKHSSGTKYVRVMADNFEKNNLLKLPKIKYITLNKEEKTIYNEIMKLSGIKKNNIKLVNKKISKAKAINIKSKSNKTIAAKKSANNKHMRVASNKKHPPSIKKNSDKTISKQKTKNNIKPRNGYKNIKNISNKNNIKNNLK